MHIDRLRWLIPAILLCGTMPAYAWGPDGHHTVATIATKLIAGTHAEQQVHAILGDLSLTDAAVWADCSKGVSTTTFKYGGAGHYAECAVFETPDGEAAMEDFVRRNSTKQLGSAVGDGIAALIAIREYLQEHHEVARHPED